MDERRDIKRKNPGMLVMPGTFTIYSMKERGGEGAACIDIFNRGIFYF